MNRTHTMVAIITGASSGIGRELALELARRGTRLGLIARRSDRLETVAEEVRKHGGEALALRCDVTRRGEFEQAVERTISHFGHLDVLVNNAGRGHYAFIEDTPDDQIENIFAVNVFSLWYGTSVALRHFRERGSGHIINISSMAGKLGYPANGAYVAAKHAVVGFTRALRAELAGTDITASVVCPGGTLTDWASLTEGGPMLELFEYEGRRGAEIARERGVELPPALPLLAPDEVARKIAELFANPVAELYTHPGSRQLALEFEQDQDRTERLLEPLWIANREGHVRMRGDGGA